MTLAMSDIQVGAIVEEMLDDTPGKNYGKRLLTRRRGVIEKIGTKSGSDFNDGSGVSEIWVRFDMEKPPEKVANARLVLNRPYDASVAFKLKQKADNERGDDILKTMGRNAQESEHPESEVVTVDKTGLDKRERLEKGSVEEKFGGKGRR